jgi:GTPase SAR1 family protein
VGHAVAKKIQGVAGMAAISRYSSSLSPQYHSPVYRKVCIAGPAGVGKTSLFLRIKTGAFPQSTPSKNPDTFNITRKVNGQDIGLLFFDSLIYDRSAALPAHFFFKGAACILLLFNVNDTYTIYQIDDILKEAQEIVDKMKCCFILVGSKVDTRASISRDTVKDRAKELRCDEICFISAKTGAGIDDLLDLIAKKITDDRARVDETIRLEQSHIDGSAATSDNGNECCR